MKCEFSLIDVLILIREVLITTVLALLLNKYKNDTFLFNLIFTALIFQSGLISTYSKNLKFFDKGFIDFRNYEYFNKKVNGCFRNILYIFSTIKIINKKDI